MTGFIEVATALFVLRYPVLDVNVTLVVGDDRALVVDTLSTRAQAEELIQAVRRVTTAPLVAVNTHHHFDHCFGNAVLAGAGAPIWAHTETVAALRDTGPRLREASVAEWTQRQPELAAGLAAVDIAVPDHTVAAETTLDLGGRAVVLRHLGRGHTAGDLVALVPDVDAVITGDLVEESGPPSFEDGYPVEWPETLAALLPVLSPGTTVVPGHGTVVGTGFLREQYEDLTALAWLIREGHADGAPAESVAGQGPFDRACTLIAAQRGYAELDGRI